MGHLRGVESAGQVSDDMPDLAAEKPDLHLVATDPVKDSPLKIEGVHAEPLPEDIATLVGRAVTPQLVLDVRRAESIARTYGDQDHMGG